MLVDEYCIDLKLDNQCANSSMGSMACDGKYFYIFGHFGLLKVGTGYQSTIKAQIYCQNENFCADAHWCLVLLSEPTQTLLFRSASIEPHCFAEIDCDSLQRKQFFDFGDDNEYFKTMDDGYFNGEWLKNYSPAFANGRYLSVLQQIKSKDGEHQ